MTEWRLIVEPLARADLRSVVSYYHDQAPEQMPRFRHVVSETMAGIRRNPHLNADVRSGYRHRATPVFPHHVWFTVDEANHTVHVLRVLHVRRDSGPLIP